jgi:hypothetical protein
MTGGGKGCLAVREVGDDFTQPAVAREWDQWVPRGHLVLSHRFLHCSQRVQMEGGFRMLPLLLTDENGDTVGVSASYLNAIDAADLGNSKLQRAAKIVRRVYRRFLKYDVIEIGLPTGVGLPARSGHSATKTVEALAGWAMDKARQNSGSLVIVRDVADSLAPDTAATLRRLDFQPAPVPATFIVPLPYGSFDEYKSRMRSAYRARMVNCLKTTSSLGCTVETGFHAMAPQLLALWRNLYDRVTRYRRLVLTEGFFEAASRLDEARLMLLRRPDESIAGFGLIMIDGPILRFSCTGFTRDAARNEGVYFRLLYEVIRLAIENGCEAVSLGQSTAGPKMSVGGQPVALQAWLWHRSRLKRRALGWLTRTLMQPAAPVVRNVFKDDVAPYSDPALLEGAFTQATEGTIPAASPVSWVAAD